MRISDWSSDVCSSDLHIMDGNGEPYVFWEKLDLFAYNRGHGYMQGIFNPGSIEVDPVSRSHYEVLEQAYGRERALSILGENRHNTIIYGSGSPHSTFQIGRASCRESMVKNV